MDRQNLEAMTRIFLWPVWLLEDFFVSLLDSGEGKVEKETEEIIYPSLKKFLSQPALRVGVFTLGVLIGVFYPSRQFMAANYLGGIVLQGSLNRYLFAGYLVGAAVALGY